MCHLQLTLGTQMRNHRSERAFVRTRRHHFSDRLHGHVHGHMATWPFLPSESRRIVLPAWYEPSLLQILGRLALRHLHSSVPVGTKRTPSPARRFHLICAAHEVKLLPVRLRQPRLTCVRRMRRGHRETSEVGHRDAAAAAAQWSRCSAIRSSRQLCRHGPSASAIRSPKLSKVRDSDLL